MSKIGGLIEELKISEIADPLQDFGLYSEMNKMESEILEEIKDYELSISSGIQAINWWNKLRCIELKLKQENTDIEKVSFVDEWLESLKTYKQTLEEVIEGIDEHLSIELEELSKLITFECGDLSLKLMRLKHTQIEIVQKMKS